ncbi:MAG: hypothetical protein J6U04_09620 [Salinivirgaceae bacterium]|nr:hypothetical protein [Salinivirgaceae bacterium]
MAIAAFVFASCSKPSVNQPIFDRAYALFSDGEYEMSEEYLKNHESDLKQPLSDADSVYLTLLKSLYKGKFTLFDLNGIADTARLNHCIDFYRKTSDSEKLAWALYLKSVKNMFSGNYATGVVVLRQAEDVAKTLTNNELKFHITLMRYSSEGSPFDLGAHGLELVEKIRPYTRSTDQKAHYLAIKTDIFFFNGLMDSAIYYIRESEKIDTTNYGFLAEYGLIFAEEEPEKSLRYALKASEINPWNDVAKMSRIKSYLCLNRLQDAIDFYQSSSIGDANRALVLEYFFDYYHRHGMSAEADRTAAELRPLVHKIFQGATESSRVYTASTNYDIDLLRLANQNRTQRIIFVAVLLFVIVITLLSAVLVRQRRRHENELARNRQILKESHDKIEELMAQNESADNKREIARLQRKIAEIEGQYAEIYSDGKRLYEAVFANGGNSGQWNKKDYEKFIEYYKTIDFSLIAQIEDDYNHLNPRQTFFRILVEKGFDKEQVMRTMGIQEDGTYRALKSKVEGLKKV